VLYGMRGKKAMCVDEETFVDELRSKKKGGCTRDPL
jgi:hypothetical protein